ncbi:hypothetical protein C8Q72DRAFT_906327 [Fomitopsis betulina]|nr:hypothetical protein C8Q72DRAFT_906327 [Fomitopsis betulina]
MAPLNITIKKIETPTEADVADATEIVCALMQDGGDITRLPLLVHAMISDIALRAGDMYGAFDEDGAMVGFQAWVPPGKVLFESDEGKAQFGLYINQLPTDESKAFVLHTVELNSHWCQFNFIKEEYHGKGISKAIMKLPLEKPTGKSKINDWTTALATTNPKNVPIYEHHGFVNEGHKLIHTLFNVLPLYAFVKKRE